MICTMPGAPPMKSSAATRLVAKKAIATGMPRIISPIPRLKRITAAQYHPTPPAHSLALPAHRAQQVLAPHNEAQELDRHHAEGARDERDHHPALRIERAHHLLGLRQ